MRSRALGAPPREAGMRRGSVLSSMQKSLKVRPGAAHRTPNSVDDDDQSDLSLGLSRDDQGGGHRRCRSARRSRMGRVRPASMDARAREMDSLSATRSKSSRSSPSSSTESTTAVSSLISRLSCRHRPRSGGARIADTDRRVPRGRSCVAARTQAKSNSNPLASLAISASLARNTEPTPAAA